MEGKALWEVSNAVGELFTVGGSFPVRRRGWKVTGLCKQGVDDKDLQCFGVEVERFPTHKGKVLSNAR